MRSHHDISERFNNVKPGFTEEDVKSCGFKFGTLGGLRNHIRSLHKEMLQAQLMLPT